MKLKKNNRDEEYKRERGDKNDKGIQFFFLGDMVSRLRGVALRNAPRGNRTPRPNSSWGTKPRWLHYSVNPLRLGIQNIDAFERISDYLIYGLVSQFDFV